MMLFFLFAWLVGYYEISLASPVKASNRMAKGRFTLYGLHREGACLVGFCLSYQKRALFRRFEKEGLLARASSLRGLPAFFVKHRYRFGAMLGILFGVASVLLSGRVIWEIDVVGNERVSESEIRSLLSAEGVYEGAVIEEIDTLAVANRILAKSPSLAFLGVNIVGSRVEAVVLEHTEPEKPIEDTRPCNLVAKKNGVVVSVSVESGESRLKAGDTVSVGDLLISGFNQLRNESYHVGRAKGVVLAETLNEISVTKSRYRYEKTYTEQIFEEKELIFFTKSKKVSKECGNLPMTCDRIEARERVMLFGEIPLPMWFVTIRYREFALKEIRMTENETVRLAREEILSAISSKPLVSYRETVTWEGDSVTLTVTYRCVEDITEEYPLFDLP